MGRDACAKPNGVLNQHWNHRPTVKSQIICDSRDCILHLKDLLSEDLFVETKGKLVLVSTVNSCSTFHCWWITNQQRNAGSTIGSPVISPQRNRPGLIIREPAGSLKVISSQGPLGRHWKVRINSSAQQS